MSDSLRDQLVNAGFKDKGKDAKSKRNLNKKKSSKKASNKPQAAEQAKKVEAENAAALAKKKALKEQIKQLIEDHKIADHTGTVAYSYQIGNRVKQLFVNEECQKGLANATLLITRLNGSTYLIPPEIGEQIKALNPEWALISANDEQSTQDTDDTYSDYQVPDDLTW